MAVGRSMLVIIWHLLAAPGTHYNDLGSTYLDSRRGADHACRVHVRQLEALGYKVSLQPAA